MKAKDNLVNIRPLTILIGILIAYLQHGYQTSSQ